jgi:hypothetical protein
MNELNTPTTQETADIENPTTTTNNAYINQISMEYMMNKTHYKSYLEKTNPHKLKEIQNLKEKTTLYEIQLNEVFQHLIENTIVKKHHKKYQYNRDIQKSFELFLTNSIKHIEKCENEKCDRKINNDLMEDEDEDEDEEYNEPSTSLSSSFWGKNVKKI